MGLLDTYRINKAIAVLLTSQDAASAETLQAVATLNRFGKSALPQLVVVALEPPADASVSARVCADSGVESDART